MLKPVGFGKNVLDWSMYIAELKRRYMESPKILHTALNTQYIDLSAIFVSEKAKPLLGLCKGLFEILGTSAIASFLRQISFSFPTSVWG